MDSTFQKIQYAVEQLPRYLDENAENSDLIQSFQKKLLSFKASFPGPAREFEKAAQGLCKLFYPNGEIDKLLQNPEHYFSDPQRAEFYTCMAKVREKLVQADRLNLFLNDLESLLPKKRNVSSGTRSSDSPQGNTHSPNFRYADIRDYRQYQQQEILAGWESAILVEDDGDHADLDAVMRRGLLEEFLYTSEGRLSYEDFFTQRIEPKENTVTVLQGGFGVGKTQLTQYIVVKKIAENPDNVILFIGQRSTSATTEGKQLLKAFRDKSFRRERKNRGRFYIVIDEPSADPVRWTKTEWKKLLNAARHYQAKIILLVRDHSNDEELLQYFSVNSADIVRLQEAVPPIHLKQEWRQWIDPEKISDSLLDELRKLPLFRLMIDNRLWRLSNQSLSSTEPLRRCFHSAYALIDSLYTERLRDKEVRTGANGKSLHDEEFYAQCDKLFQYVAFKLCENDGSVSLTEGTPDQLAIWSVLIEDGFVKNIIKIDSRKGQGSQDVIKGFYYESFYHYFLVRELRDRLISGEELEDALSLLVKKKSDIMQMIQHNMLADGLYDIPNDLKQKAVKNLRPLKKFYKSSDKELVAILLDLLTPESESRH